MINYLNVMLAVITLCQNWPRIIANKLFGFPIKNIILRNGTKFSVDKKIGKADLSMLVEIWYRQFYTPPFFEIRPGDIVFDIGANNGFFTLFAAIKATKGKVFAFEPLPHLVTIINNSVAANKLINVSVEPIALTDTTGESVFYQSLEHNGCHSLYRRSPSDIEIKIKTDTLENFCRQKNITKINLMKLDCEGAEYAILLNMSDKMTSQIERLSMEYHDDINIHRHEEVVTFLETRGFQVTCCAGYLYALNRRMEN